MVFQKDKANTHGPMAMFIMDHLNKVQGLGLEDGKIHRTLNIMKDNIYLTQNLDLVY